MLFEDLTWQDVGGIIVGYRVERQAWGRIKTGWEPGFLLFRICGRREMLTLRSETGVEPRDYLLQAAKVTVRAAPVIFSSQREEAGPAERLISVSPPSAARPATGGEGRRTI